MVFFAFLAFGDPGEQEEIDFLLFLPNSSNKFVNEDQAKIQLDALAKYLMGRNLVPGQISVYGYAAAAVNNIEPMNLSRDRALFVIHELQKRGVQKDLFSDPVAYGEVALWGGNANEEGRRPNRRARVLLDGDFLTPVELVTPVALVTPDTMAAGEAEIETSGTGGDEKAAVQEILSEEPRSGFPWKFLLPLLIVVIIAAIIFFLSRNRKRSIGETVKETSPPVSPPEAGEEPRGVVEPIAVVAAGAATAAAIAIATREIIVNLEEEIRFRAYEHHLQHADQYADVDGDWYKAVPEICARYEAEGYETYTEAGTWWARRH